MGDELYTMNIKITDARPEHVEGIQEVFYKAWLGTYPNAEHGITVDDVEDRFKDRMSDDRLNKRRENIASPDSNNKFLIALDGDTVVGVCRAKKEELINRLGAIYVLPEYQSKGVGTMLWQEVRSFFDPTKDIVVSVAVYNQKAVGFYSKLGFVDTGKRFTEERLRMKSGALLPEMEMRISAGSVPGTAPIKHIWFDFSETVAFLKKERHDRLRYETYSQVIGKPLSDELITEYESLYKKFNHSNAAIFRSLGKPPSFWSEHVNAVEPSELYELADKNIPTVLENIRKLVPISVFSNIQLRKILPSLHINPEWFTHIVDAGMIKEPKPALDGFYKMIELSNLSPEQILYIGDDVGKDVLPAKKVGMKTGLMWKKSDEADYSFNNFQDILGVLSNKMNFEIKTSRLTLVPVSPKYREEIFKEFTPEVTVFMAPPSAKHISETDAFIAGAQAKMGRGEEITCTILDSATGEFLGGGGLHEINTPTPELGIWVKKSAHGHHYGRETMAALKEWADQHLVYEYIKYPVAKDNIPSRKIPEALGGTVVKEYEKENGAGKKMIFVEYHIPSLKE